MGRCISKSKRIKFTHIKDLIKKMSNNSLALGMDFGTSGVRIAIINTKKKNTIHILKNKL